jgi:hypothetical protein
MKVCEATLAVKLLYLEPNLFLPLTPGRYLLILAGLVISDHSHVDKLLRALAPTRHPTLISP